MSSREEDAVEERSSMASHVVEVDELSGADVAPNFGDGTQYRHPVQALRSEPTNTWYFWANSRSGAS